MYIINFYNYIVLIFVQNHKSRENIFFSHSVPHNRRRSHALIFIRTNTFVFSKGGNGGGWEGGEAINNHVERSPAVKSQNCARSWRARGGQFQIFLCVTIAFDGEIEQNFARKSKSDSARARTRNRQFCTFVYTHTREIQIFASSRTPCLCIL